MPYATVPDLSELLGYISGPHAYTASTLQLSNVHSLSMLKIKKKEANKQTITKTTITKIDNSR